MTIPYGGTRFGLGEQQIADAKRHGIALLKHMEHSWGAYMGRMVYDGAQLAIKRLCQLLSKLEHTGKLADEVGEFVKWQVPITDFIVVQNYIEGDVKKIWVQYGPPEGPRLKTGYYQNTLQMAVCHLECMIPSKGKQAQGLSPNYIHSLDAAHLMMVVDACPFPVSTIHDSYGALLADMPDLFRIVREQFVRLYASDPLAQICNQLNIGREELDIGTLDIEDVLQTEYSFS